ncbi:hypothetical protein AVEN_267536-1 [Araneus ventricosus]|uniref:Transposase IS30-like HTH domain-containing protein n=1 Tax=Araneus ventricosus TaxID=182803 RepID=A0A4Y2MV63_ARAVE|nr:hypothetical protein AVEN_267536-1 [Araneus ventricosus]
MQGGLTDSALLVCSSFASTLTSQICHDKIISSKNQTCRKRTCYLGKGKLSFVLRYKMPKASQLSNKEVSKILHLKLLGKTVKKISKLLNRSKSMIYRVLTRKTPYETKPRSGRPRVMDIRSDRRIQRVSSKSENVGSRNY